MIAFPVKRLPSLLSAPAALVLGLATVTALRAAEPQVNGRPLSSIAESKIEIPEPRYWAGEVFTVTHSTSVERRFFNYVAPDFQWTPEGVVIEEWSPQQRTAADGREIVSQTARAYVRGTGTVQLAGARQAVRLTTSVAADRTPIPDDFTLEATAPKLTIRELPKPAPSEFQNAVGDYNLRSSLSSLNVGVGDSVTWTLELTGTGNWPEITRLPKRVLSKDFQAGAAVLKRNIKQGSLFDGSLVEDIMIVPTKAGEYQIGPVRYVYFDPKTGKFQMITTETFTLTVAAKSGAAAIAAATTPDRYRPTNTVKTPIPAAPQPLPLDPLKPAALGGMSPMDPEVLKVVLIIAAAIFAGYWLVLAYRQSQLTDALYPRRRARKEIERILREIDHASLPKEEVRRLIYAWQKAVTEFAGLKLAVPSAAQIAQAIEGVKPGESGSSWAPLWRDSNAALYSEFPVLSPDWVMRARAALSERTLPAVPLGALFLRRNIVPFATAMLALGLALAPHSVRADGIDQYMSGDFAAAEKSWREAAKAAPLDAHARYNLALAAAQQNRWPESLAQSLAAFCLEPRNASIRWQLALSLDRAGIDNPQISSLSNGTTRYKIARTLSPSEWDVAIIAAALAACVLGALLMAGLYNKRGRGYCWGTGVATLVAVAVIWAGMSSLKCYGQLADQSIVIVSRNVLLCSVPTEIDTSQKTSPLPAGSLAKVDKNFLGWSHLVFPNGQTGWAQTNAITHLYK